MSLRSVGAAVSFGTRGETTLIGSAGKSCVESVPTKLICFDCDSTLSAIEGVDELARAGGAQIYSQVEAMTNDAMNGKIPVEAVFGRRLDLIRPNRRNVEAVGRNYLETLEPTAASTIEKLVSRGWTPVIVSGGFRQAIQPLAMALKIDRVEAVDLFFDESGNYTGYDSTYPTTRSGGKPEVIARLKRELNPVETIMVGDGASDLEAKPQVDRFIGFGRYVTRVPVKNGADGFILSLDELLDIL
jgi:phosphoserine phosphatase